MIGKSWPFSFPLPPEADFVRIIIAITKLLLCVACKVWREQRHLPWEDSVAACVGLV